MQVVDFMKIPWSNWTTNGIRMAINFVIAVIRLNGKVFPNDELFPTFSFTLKTEKADGTALKLYEMYRAREQFRLDRGPLDGGTYFVSDGKWVSNMGMMRSGDEVIQGPPMMCHPAQFTLTLTGPPDSKDLLESA